MSENWVKDINEMHKKFGVHDWVKKELENNEWSRLQKFLNFRMKMVQEEVDETNEAIQHKDPEEIVDGLIDICVFAIGIGTILKKFISYPTGGCIEGEKKLTQNRTK